MVMSIVLILGFYKCKDNTLVTNENKSIDTQIGDNQQISVDNDANLNSYEYNNINTTANIDAKKKQDFESRKPRLKKNFIV